MSQIVLTESKLHQMIAEAIEEVMTEQDVEEGWLGDKWNQAKQAGRTFINNKNQGFGQRIQNARQNWNNQGQLNNMNNLIAQLSNFVDANNIDPNTTIAQLIGGKYRQGKFGKMTSKTQNYRQGINRLGGQAEEE